MNNFAWNLGGLLILTAGVAQAETAIGDWGHFLSYCPPGGL